MRKKMTRDGEIDVRQRLRDKAFFDGDAGLNNRFLQLLEKLDVMVESQPVS